jgi:hypothetical protein
MTDLFIAFQFRRGDGDEPIRLTTPLTRSARSPDVT